MGKQVDKAKRSRKSYSANPILRPRVFHSPVRKEKLLIELSLSRLISAVQKGAKSSWSNFGGDNTNRHQLLVLCELGEFSSKVSHSPLRVRRKKSCRNRSVRLNDTGDNSEIHNAL